MTIAVAMPQNAIPPMTPRCVALKSNDRPQAGKTSCRITNEKAEAIREYNWPQTIDADSCARSPERKSSPPHREKLVQEAGMIVNNRAVAAVPGGTRSKFRQGLGINGPRTRF